MLTPNPVPLLLAASLEVHEMTWKCLDFFALGFTNALLKKFQTKFSLNSSSQSGNSSEKPLCTSDSPFLFLFSVSVGLCSGFHRSSPLVVPLLSGTGFSVYLLTSNTESCDEDDGEVGEGAVEEELADKPGTTSGTELDFLKSIILPFLMRCGF